VHFYGGSTGLSKHKQPVLRSPPKESSARALDPRPTNCHSAMVPFQMEPLIILSSGLPYL
jgi:hypothetical protein